VAKVRHESEEKEIPEHDENVDDQVQ